MVKIEFKCDHCGSTEGHIEHGWAVHDFEYAIVCDKCHREESLEQAPE